MPNLVETMKRIAVNAVEATNPTSIVFGKVVDLDPLKINIDQRLTIPEEHLILTSLVSDFSVGISDLEVTETKTIKLGLQINEKVILLRVQGGQKYIVLDRLR